MQEIWKEYPYDKRYQVSNLGRFKSIKGDIMKQRIDSQNYLCIGLGKIKARSHIFIAETFLSHIRCGHKIVVDHIDNNPQNNRVDNLQLVTHRVNCSKDKKDKTSKYTGLSLDRNKYRAQACLGGKVYFLGKYDTEEEAYIARIDAIYEYNEYINE